MSKRWIVEPSRALLVAVACAAAFDARAVTSQRGLAGSWSGQWERGGAKLEVELNFTRTEAGYAGSFSSAQLRAAGVPLDGVRFDPPRVSWRLVGDATATQFEGELHGDTLEGRFREAGAVGTFRLRRHRSPRAALREQDITFHDGDVALSGTVIRPAGRGPFPGVVFLHGSGPEGRWASRYLANAFAEHGVAALVYDKRGVGRSSGDWRQAGFAELVADAVTAVEALRLADGIDRARVGIHGHSQGGTIAPWVACESAHVAFVIGSAAAGVSMADAEAYSLRNSIGVGRLPEAERALADRFVSALVRTAYEGAPRSELDRAWEAVRTRPWAFEPPPETDAYWAFSRRIASYDPLAYWRRVSAPALLVYGDADERVPARQSAARISDAYLSASGTRLDVILYPGADHTFRMQPGVTNAFRWPESADGYPDALIRWVLEVTDSTRR